MENSQLKTHILSIFKQIIASWIEPDIYVISFWVNNYCDNPCEPTVTLGYNTERQYKNNITNASDKSEARWNFAFWLQNSEFIYGEGKTKKNIEKWIRVNGLPYYPCINYDYDIPDDVNEELLLKITTEFVSILVEIAKELQETNFIIEKFGKSIPIIIHELEYYDQIAEQNIKANTLPVVNDFIEWIRDMKIDN